jgi:hypothetical protein
MRTCLRRDLPTFPTSLGTRPLFQRQNGTFTARILENSDWRAQNGIRNLSRLIEIEIAHETSAGNAVTLSGPATRLKSNGSGVGIEDRKRASGDVNRFHVPKQRRHVSTETNIVTIDECKTGLLPSSESAPRRLARSWWIPRRCRPIPPPAPGYRR